MGRPETSKIRYEWTLTEDTGDEEWTRVQCIGTDSKDVLTLLFIRYLRNRGDVSDWSDRKEFGMVIDEHSNLDEDVVAVWLGIYSGLVMYGEDLEAYAEYGLFETEPPYEFEGPDGNRITLDRSTGST